MKELNSKLLDILVRTFTGIGATYSALDTMTTQRIQTEGEGENLGGMAIFSPQFKRTLKEHKINSDILGGALANYRTSLDKVYEELKAELLSEGQINDKDNMRVRPARPMGQVEPRGREEILEELRRLPRLGGGFALPRDDRGDGLPE